jgi:predicted nucleic acid-binding Zn ribbon protein
MRMPENLNQNRSKTTMSLKDAMEKMLKKNSMMAEFKRQAISANWSKIVGEIMAKRTEQVKVANHTLIITVNSAPMKHQMLINKSRIIALVNEFIGESIIHDIYIQ